MEIYGKRPFKRLYDLGVLDENFIAAHAVHINDEDMKIIKKTKINIVYNPSANMKLADGICPASRLLKEGVCVSLGTDSPASNDNINMFEEMKIASLLQKISNNDAAAMRAQETLDAATLNAARALGAESSIGSIEKSKLADMIFIDKNEITMNPMNKGNIAKNLVYSFSGNVSDVMVGGKFLVKKFLPTTLDRDRIVKKIDEMLIKRTA